MTTLKNEQPWADFQSANHHRRAIRHFSDAPIAEAEMLALLSEASLAPSSVNLQPYEFHWVRNPELKALVAGACNGQKAASTAAEIIVVVASTAFARNTIVDQLAYIDGSASMPPASKDYHRKHLNKFDQILKIGKLALWSPLVSLITLFRPGLSLLPIGHLGSRHWAARNAIFAAHTLMLGAAAKGIDSCPMEGFSATKISQLLSLPRGAVIPLVIALGHRADSARIEEQWRRPLERLVIEH
jgi:nitroreductase